MDKLTNKQIDKLIELRSYVGKTLSMEQFNLIEYIVANMQDLKSNERREVVSSIMGIFPKDMDLLTEWC